jgi:CRISPR system Cascade subunit CasE
MYLSRLFPNVRCAAARRDLADYYEMHRTVMRALPSSDEGGSGRALFRLDADRATQRTFLLVQSQKLPNWEKLEPSYVARPAECKQYAPEVVRNQRLRFRLRANPTAKRKRSIPVDAAAGRASVGKRVGLLREEDQLAWLRRKAEGCGFTVNSADVVPEGRVVSHRAGGPSVTHWAARFDGLLTVTDPPLFVRSIEAGIGAAKGFGFGLLSIAPP